MTQESINKLKVIQENIKNLSFDNSIIPEVICISKTFGMDKILPLINSGHRHFGENKVQETEKKWNEIRYKNDSIKLHLVGKLQSNKAKKAVELFDFIHSLDSTKLADNLQKRENEIKKKLSYFIQVNIGNEPQKGGVQLHEVESFLKYCKTNTKLNIIGLMVIPPFDTDVEKYFSEISLLNTKLGFKHLSMGMSEDYKLSIKFKSTFLRIGSAIFGPRNINK